MSLPRGMIVMAAPVYIVDVNLVALHSGVPPHSRVDSGPEAVQVAKDTSCKAGTSQASSEWLLCLSSTSQLKVD